MTQPDECLNRRAPRLITAVTVAAMAALVAATTWGTYSSGEHDLLALDIATGVMGCALVPFLLRRPVHGAVILAILAAVSPSATPLSTLGTLRVAQTRQLRIAIAVAVVGTAAHVMRGAWRPENGISLRWWIVLVVIAHVATVAAGGLSRSHSALIRSLRQRAERAEAEQGRRVAEARALERTRIAREMHDVLAHRLSLLATYAGALEYRPDSPPERLAEAAGVIRSGVHDALDELRDVISLLRDEETGADSTQRPQPTLTDVPSLVDESRAAGMRIEFDDRVDNPGGLPPAIGRAAYRVVQESLTNARKHAVGQAVHIRLSGRAGEGLRLTIDNALTTPSPDTRTPGAGIGLVGLTERVRLIGGQLDHRVTVPQGFILEAQLPWPA